MNKYSLHVESVVTLLWSSSAGPGSAVEGLWGRSSVVGKVDRLVFLGEARV